jgi:hypothetical protein
VYRTSQPTQSVPLLHRLKNAQLFYLDRALCLAEELSSVQQLLGSNAPLVEGEGIGEVVRDLDRAYLLLCIALLDHTDHTIQGDYF